MLGSQTFHVSGLPIEAALSLVIDSLFRQVLQPAMCDGLGPPSEDGRTRMLALAWHNRMLLNSASLQ